MGASTAGVFGEGRAAPPPLVVSSYTLGTEVGFEDRVRAAAAAGYEGVGLRAENYWDARAAGLDDDAMREIAVQHGVPIVEVEYITAWGTAEDRDAAQQEKEQAVFHMARAFGVRHLNTGLLEKLPLDVMTEAFAALCDRAGDDLTVALEFMPYSGVPDLATAWQIIDDADRANGALIVDVWHWARAGMTPADLDPVPPTASSPSSSATSSNTRWSRCARSPSATAFRRARATGDAVGAGPRAAREGRAAPGRHRRGDLRRAGVARRRHRRTHYGRRRP